MPHQRFGSLRSIAVALLAAMPLAGAAAQERDLDTEPSAGKVFTGSLSGADGPARFLLTLQPGQAIDLTAAPVAGSDPYLRVYDAASNELLAENDDAGGTLAATVRLFSERRRRVRIEVSNAAVEGTDGAVRFDLVLRPTDYRPRPPRAIAMDESAAGTLATGDEQVYTFAGEQGQAWNLAATAAAGSRLDPALQVFAGERAVGTAVAQDDDGGGGLNARLRFVVPEDGTYSVRVYGIGSSEGAYQFSAGRTPPVPPAAALDLELGRGATGTLDGETREQFYRLGPDARAALAAEPGPLTIELRRIGDAEEGSDAVLDPMLEVGFQTPLGFTSMLSDDDGGGETNARLELDAAQLTGDWLAALRIKAAAFLESQGHYELTVSRAD